MMPKLVPTFKGVAFRASQKKTPAGVLARLYDRGRKTVSTLLRKAATNTPIR